MQALAALLLLAQAPSPDQWSCAQKEDFLRTAKVVAMKDLSQGITNSRRATLQKDGVTHDAHVQTINEQKASFQGIHGSELNFKDSYAFNVAAYKLDRILDLNMIPVSVVRKVGGTEAAVTWWVDDAIMTELDRYKKGIASPNPNQWNQQMWIVRVFDQLIANTDRNLGNLVICKNWDIWMIDHTRAFRARRDLINPANLQRCDRTLLERLRKLDYATLEAAFKPHVTKTEIEGLLARRDRIVEYFDAQVRAKGEANVLYDYLPARAAKYVH
jgi:hypothetical protein